MKKQDQSGLILIDIQKGFEDIDYWSGNLDNVDAEENAKKLLAFWRGNDLPVFHVNHCSSNSNSRLAEGKEGKEFKEVVQPIERINY